MNHTLSFLDRGSQSGAWLSSSRDQDYAVLPICIPSPHNGVSERTVGFRQPQCVQSPVELQHADHSTGHPGTQPQVTRFARPKADEPGRDARVAEMPLAQPPSGKELFIGPGSTAPRPERDRDGTGLLRP
jgi:hypothetical protein